MEGQSVPLIYCDHCRHGHEIFDSTSLNEPSTRQLQLISPDCLSVIDYLPWSTRSPDFSPVEQGKSPDSATQNVGDLKQQWRNVWIRLESLPPLLG
ncbi:hypothetical protein CEXT_738381 [Caerostris extrusa]|uniref:Uncharacterized protein n=1 Tax=Caerostris extrusa TaxID=172846 RepID=A0AAV4VR49_CAEEX|nr:hypothetical protein CEXT_738381 [Caerostris extrusa]